MADPKKSYYKVSTKDITPGVAPLHEESNSWCTVLNDDLECYVTDIRPGGAALKDNHPDCDHMFYYVSGYGYQIVEGERIDFGPGDTIFVSRNCDHEMYPLGQETVKMVVTMTPTREFKKKMLREKEAAEAEKK